MTIKIYKHYEEYYPAMLLRIDTGKLEMRADIYALLTKEQERLGCDWQSLVVEAYMYLHKLNYDCISKGKIYFCEDHFFKDLKEYLKGKTDDN